MCDCYYHKCSFCDNEINIHIPDFGVPRSKIRAVCPNCLKERDGSISIYTLLDGAAYVTREKITDKETVRANNEFIGRLYHGDRALIACDQGGVPMVTLNQADTEE